MTGDHGEARPAIRCAECHGDLHEQWLTSGHARSNHSPAYLAMRRATGPAACDPCHAPLAAVAQPGDLVVGEGIGCDVCHAIKEIDVEGARTRITFGLAEDTKWGTLCEAQQHYFHKTGCSPVFQASRLCAACHRWSMEPTPGHPLAILTEYDEWVASPAAAAGETCQKCHMPRAQAELATGWKRTSQIGHHGLMGAAGDMRQRAVSVRLSAFEAEGALRAEVTLKNEGNGHAEPTGLPGRQIVLRVAALDAAGRAIDRGERVYTRTLVDAAGHEAPFYSAIAEGSDTRLRPLEARRESFSLRADGAHAIVAELAWRRTSPALAAALGIDPDEHALSEARVELGPAGSRGLPPAKAATPGSAGPR